MRDRETTLGVRRQTGLKTNFWMTKKLISAVEREHLNAFHCFNSPQTQCSIESLGNGRGRVTDDISHPSTDLTSLPDSTPPLSHSLFIIARRGKWAFVIITQGESWMVVVQPRKEEGKKGAVFW